MTETFTYVHAVNTAVTTLLFGVLLPGAHGESGTPNDAWLATGRIKSIQGSFWNNAGTGKMLVHVYDALVESTQQLVKGGATPKFGKVALGGAWTGLRSFANPKTGLTTAVDLFRYNGAGLAAIPADLTGLRLRKTIALTELTGAATGTAPPVSVTPLDIPCMSGIVLICENQGTTIAAPPAGVSAMQISVEYDLQCGGYERFRRSTLPNRAAVSY